MNNTYWPNDIGRHDGQTIPVEPWPAEASTELGADQDDDIAGARGIVNAIVLTVCCALLALCLAAICSIA